MRHALTTPRFDRARSVTSWRPARMFPDSYPGDWPESAYLLVDGQVVPVDADPGEGLSAVSFGERIALDDLLSQLGAAPFDRRVPVLAYGANRNPATLARKLLDHGAPGASSPQATPVLPAILSGADVVGAGLHGQGYLYGELLLDAPGVRETTVEVAVVWADAELLRALNDSEGLREGLYAPAALPGLRLRDLDRSVTALAYASRRGAYVSSSRAAPLAYEAVRARGRSLPAFDALGMLECVLDDLDLRGFVAATLGLAPGRGLGAELMAALNGGWWYAFHTGRAPIEPVRRVLAEMNARMQAFGAAICSAEVLERRGSLIPVERAYNAAELARTLAQGAPA